MTSVSIERSPEARGGFRLRTELLVAEPRDQVFAFFADASQLETITPPWLHFSVITPRPITMQSGSLIDYRLRLHGMPIRWRSRISEWKPPFQFVDEQVKGPYRHWRHLHTFEERDDGTLVRDVVDYDFLFSRLMHPLLVRRDLTTIFDYRQEVMCRIFTRLDTAPAAAP